MSISKSVNTILTTPRLVLRGPSADDLDAMFAIYSDPRAMVFWSTDPHPDRETTAKSLNWRIQAWTQQQVNFQITLDGVCIGNAGNFRDNEIGFMLHPDHWRKGYVTEAMRTIIPHIFATTDLLELTADIDPHNTASKAALHKLGFHQTHTATNTFFIGGSWCDSAYFALPRPASQR